MIVGFDTKIENGVQAHLKRTGVRIVTHDIIYELITLVKDAMSELLDPEVRENKLGGAEVRAVFPLGKEHKVAGCMVTEGLVRRQAKARLVRKGQIIHQGPVETLRRFKDDASEVKAGFECGIKLGGYDEYQPGDIIEVVEMLQVRPSL
jgi:translation initiation factor IF-2